MRATRRSPRHSRRSCCRIGLPAAYSPANARLTALAGDSVLALDDSALRVILRGGVLMDARAAIGLHERGMGDLVGFSVEGFREADCIEELVVHPLNGRLRRKTT